jgi:cell division protein FtsB
VLIALSIPGLLALDGLQAGKFAGLERDVADLEKKQVEFIDSNRKLITEISRLANSDNIEKTAREKLGMRKAQTGEIVRIEMIK